MQQLLRSITAAAVVAVLAAGCNGGGSNPPAPLSSASAPASSTQSYSVAANTPTTLTGPSAGGYTPALTIPGVTTPISAQVTTSTGVPTGVATFSSTAPHPLSVASPAVKPAGATTLLYVSFSPSASTTVSAGGTFGVNVALPAAPAAGTSYYLALFNGSSWSTSLVSSAGTVSGSSVSWTATLSANVVLQANMPYALAVYSVPTGATGATPTPSSAATGTPVTGQPVPSALPVPSPTVAAKSLPVPTPTPVASGSPAPVLSSVDQGTQTALAGALTSIKSRFIAASVAGGARVSPSLVHRIAQGKYRGKKDDTVPTCSNGVAQTVTSNDDGTTTVVNALYADSACATTLASATTWIYQPVAADGSVTAAGARIVYAADGMTQTGYDVLNQTAYNATATDGSSDVVTSTTHYPNSTNMIAPTGIDYQATVVSAGGAENDGCVSFTYDLVDGYELGSAYTSSNSIGQPDASGNVTSSISGTSQLYSDPTYQLAVAANPLAPGVSAWQINGNTLTGSTSVNQTATVDPNGNLINASTSAADQTHDVQIGFQSSSNGYTGSISQISTGTTLGSITTDNDGDGTVTYADGSSSTISQFAISD